MIHKMKLKESLNNKVIIRKVKYEDIEQIVDININDYLKRSSIVL